MTATEPSSPRRSATRRCSRATSCSAPGGAARYYLDKYRFSTRPDLLGPLGAAIADGGRRARARRGPPRRARSSAPCRSPPPPRSRRAAVRDRARRGEGLRHREPDRGRLRAGRVRLPRRGRRHRRRRRARGRRGAARGRPAGLERGLRRRPRGGRRRRARARRRAAPAALPRLRASRGREPPASPHG